jgi:hypothetical protein
MVKIQLLFISLFLTYGLACFSQSLSLSNKFGPVAPNSTIIQSGTPDSNTLLTYLDVKNTSGNSINVLCKKQELSMLDSTQTYMCWANFCYAPHILVSPNAVPLGAGETYSGFKAIYAQIAYNNFFIGESIVRWVFFDQQNPDDSVSVTVRYQTFPVGLDEVSTCNDLILNIFPNPAGERVQISYLLPAFCSGTVLIQNLQGAVVQQHQVSAGTNSVSADITHLCEGIYFCSLLVDGKRTPTKKLIVNQ